MARKKKPEPVPKKKPEKKPVEWTTDEALTRLFPRHALDAVRHKTGLADDQDDRSIPKA